MRWRGRREALPGRRLVVGARGDIAYNECIRSVFHASTCVLALVAALAAASRVSAQALPSRPIATADGRLTVSLDASVSMSTSGDEYAYFNYTDYQHNLLRLFAFDASGAFKATDRLTVLGQIRLETAVDQASSNVRPYALFVRVRPWTARAIAIQAGLIPPSFGTSTRSYGSDNPLIGSPLADQYLTSLRADAVPASADDLLRMRGQGWSATYQVGSQEPREGLPVVNARRWASGVQVNAGSGAVAFSAAVTGGAPSAPRASLAGGGAQIAARLAVTPLVGLRLGVSGAVGQYLDDGARQAARAAGGRDASLQRALGFDAEYSRGYWLVRAEGVISGWDVPTTTAPLIAGPVWALGVNAEARYKIRPGLYAAARIDHLGFSRITGSLGTNTWDANVTRIEAGGGYSIQRNLVVKAVLQQNWRDGDHPRPVRVGAVQLVFWL